MLGLAVILGLRGARGADAGPSLESRVKAAFVLNFVQFTRWPEESLGKKEDPLVIGVLDPDRLEGMLEKTVEDRVVQGRKLEVRHFAKPEQVRGCHVLVVGDNPPEGLSKLLGELRNQSVLTIGEQTDFMEAGGVIRFFIEDRKVRFEINTAAAERAKLQISSKLLKLAKVVKK